jgi:hypothetical protein
MTTSQFAREGAFAVEKAVKYIRGRERKVRSLVFRTHDGYAGESREFDRREAYEAALACRVRAQHDQAVACPKAAPHVVMLAGLDSSTLFAEVERRGYEVCVP